MPSTLLHWVASAKPLKLALAAHPHGRERLLTDLESWRQAGVQSVVSLLPLDEAADLGLTLEEATCKALGMKFSSLPIPDMRTPSHSTQTHSVIHHLAADLMAGVAVVVHCRAGIGRTGLVSASILASLGWSTQAAVQALSQTRGTIVPETQEQVKWIETFARGVSSAA